MPNFRVKFLKNWAKPISLLNCLVVFDIVKFCKKILCLSGFADISSLANLLH